MAAYIDPWRGYNEGMQGLGQTFNDLENQKIKRDAAARQAEMDAMKLEEARYNQETRRGLATAMGPTITKQVPIQQRLAAGATYAAGRGDTDLAAKLANSIDITNKIAATGQMPELDAMMKTANNIIGLGGNSDTVKSILKQKYPQLSDKIDAMNFERNVGTLKLADGREAVVVTQPDGKQSVHIVNQTGMNPELKQQELVLKRRQLELSSERNQLAALRLNPDLQARLEQAKKVGGAQGKAAQEASDKAMVAELTIKRMDDLEAKINSPDMQWGVAGELATKLGTLSPTLSKLLQTGQMEQLLVSAPDLMLDMKKLLGPQISNADAAMMMRFTGGDFRSKERVLAAINRIRNSAQKDISDAATMASRIYSPAARRMVTGKQEPFSKDTIRTLVAQEAKSMKAGDSKRIDFNGRFATVTKNANGGVSVKFD